MQIEKGKLSDGLNGYIVVADRAAVGLDILRDDKIFVEMKTLKISNASDVGGLAGEVSRVALVLGIRVLDMGSSNDKYRGVCSVKGGGEQLRSLAARRITQIYGCDQSIKELNSAADLELIIGDRFAKEF